MTDEVYGLSPLALSELKRLEHEDGSLVASEVLDAARNERNPLHQEFTWDDHAAAEAHRLNQARNLIRRYKVRVIRETAEGEEREVLVRGYVAARNAGGGRAPGTYLPARELSGQERELLLRTMRREIAALRTRFGAYSEFWQVLDEMREAAASGSAS